MIVGAIYPFFIVFLADFCSMFNKAAGQVAIAPKPQTKSAMEEKINQILVYSLLAAKNVLTLEDVALLTGLSKSHLYRLTCTHQIPYYKPNGKQIYFDRGEVEAWMKQNRVATRQEAEQAAVAYVVTGKRKGGAL